MNFAVPPKALEYGDYLLPFELLYRYIHNLDITNEKNKVLKTRIKDCAFSLFNSYNENGAPLNLTSEELAVLKSLSKNISLIIQKSDKGYSIAISDRSNYLEIMRSILSDSSKFTQVSISEDKQLNFIFDVEKYITELLKDLKISEVISETVNKSLKPRGSKFGILYGLCKVQKQLVDDCPPARPNMSTTKTSTYNLAKFLVLLLDPFTTSMYTVKNNLSFPKKWLTRNQEFSCLVWMSSLSLAIYL